MFARSILPTLSALVLLACGSVAVAEPLDAQSLLPAWIARLKPLSLTQALQREATWLRGIGRDSIEPGAPAASLLRAPLANAWLDGEGVRPGNRLSFSRASDDERAGSSASLTLGRLNLNETRGNPVLGGGTSQGEFERDVAQLRDNINRVRLSPQVSLGMRVKF